MRSRSPALLARCCSCCSIWAVGGLLLFTGETHAAEDCSALLLQVLQPAMAIYGHIWSTQHSTVSRTMSAGTSSLPTWCWSLHKMARRRTPRCSWWTLEACRPLLQAMLPNSWAVLSSARMGQFPLCSITALRMNGLRQPVSYEDAKRLIAYQRHMSASKHSKDGYR